MGANRKCIVMLLALLFATAPAIAQQTSQPAETPARALCRVKMNRGLVDAPADVYLEAGQVTFRDESQAVVLSIADAQLVDATATTRRGGLPFVKLSEAFRGSDGDVRTIGVLLVTAVAWDTAVGFSRLFRHPRHFVTITYSGGDDTRSESVQLSGKDASKLVKALQARRLSAASSGAE